jgi:hypothetical protein
MEQEAPWDEIACAWHDVAVPVAQIAVQYGMTPHVLVTTAKARGWPSRGELKRKPAKPAAKSGQAEAKAAATNAQARSGAKAAAQRAKSVNPRTLVNRIYNTIDQELSKLEQHDGESSQDRERASRALSQMVSSLEKAIEMQREITKAQGRPQVSGKDKEALKHAEELRREIADRLERLHRKRAAAG